MERQALSLADVRSRLFLAMAVLLSLASMPQVSWAVAPCASGFVFPRLVPVAGSLRHIVIDPSCQYLYISDSGANRILVYSIADQVLQAPIAVGSQPVGFDITPDGSRMYVANSGGNNLSVVDLALRQEIKRIVVPPAAFINDKPVSLAIVNNGLALFSTSARVMQLDLATETVSQRTDFEGSWGPTQLTASADRTKVAIVTPGIGSGPVFVYSSATNTISDEKDLSTFIAYGATDRTGSTILVNGTQLNGGTYVLDGTTLNVLGTIPGFAFGVAVDPSGLRGYRVAASVVVDEIEVLDLRTLLKTGSRPLGDTIEEAPTWPLGGGIGNMAISGDGSLLAVITDHGFSLVGTVAANRDFNGDARADIIWRHTSGAVYEWLLDGTSVVGTGSPGMADTDWRIVGVGDFNGDGRADILWRHTSGSLYIWLLDGTTVIGTGGLGAPGTDWQVAGVGDFNGDGRADILWRHDAGLLYIWLMDGTRGIGSGSPGSVGTDWTIAGVGDFNADGRADILLRHASGALAEWLLNGTTLVGIGSLGGVTVDWAVVGVGDFNGDGRADILWRHASGALYEWLLNGSTVIGTGSLGSVDTDWQVVRLADFNGDGRSDILWRHASGLVYEWLLDGTTIIGTGSPGSAGIDWQIQ